MNRLKLYEILYIIFLIGSYVVAFIFGTLYAIHWFNNPELTSMQIFLWCIDSKLILLVALSVLLAIISSIFKIKLKRRLKGGYLK